MSERTKQFYVGVVVIATALIGAFLIISIGDRPIWPLGDSYQLFIEFPDAPGVTKGTPVRKFGKTIGRVERVDIVDNGVRVTVSIDGGQTIPAHDIAEVSSSLLGGDAIIEFVANPRRPAPPPSEPSAHQDTSEAIQFASHRQPSAGGDFQPGATIPGRVRPSPMEVLVDMQSNLEGTVQSLGEAGTAVAGLATKLDKLLADADTQRLKEVVDQTQQALTSLTATMNSLNNIFGDPVLQADLRQGIQDLPALIRDAQNTLGQIEGAATAAENNLRNLEGLTGPLGDRGDEIADRLASAATNLDSLLSEVAAFTESINNRDGTLGQIIYNRELYDRVTRITQNIEYITRQIQPILRDAGVFTDKIARKPNRVIISREAPIK